MQQQQTISWLDCDLQWKVDFIWQPVTTSSVIGLRRSSKALPKAKLAHIHTHTQMVMVSNWWSAAHLNHYSFLNLSKTVTTENYAQRINERQWKLSCLHLTGIGQQNGPNSFPQQHWIVTQPMLQKLNKLGCKIFPYLPYSLDLSITDYHFLKISTTFCREDASSISRRQKMFSKSSSNAKPQIFMLKEINKHISHWQKNKVLIVMVPILINKDVFEPSYNDLKFMAPNCKYTCTNLIFAMILVNVSWVLLWVFSL